MSNTLLPSLVLPLQDRKLILPQNVVVEVIPLSGLIVESRRQRWILGHKHWRNMRIPVISLETLAGGSLKKHSEHARIAVLKRTGNDEELSFWGLLVQSMPTGMKVGSTDIHPLDDHLSETELMSLRVKNEAVRIPNLSHIEGQINASGVLHQGL